MECNRGGSNSGDGGVVTGSATLPGLDIRQLEWWLAREHPDMLSERRLRAKLIVGGLSNLSYRIDGGREPWVLRRPPLGHVLTTAHDMRREHRVISALHDTRVPVPRTHVYHQDSTGQAGVGTEFFIMDYVDGVLVDSKASNADWTPEQRQQFGPMLASTLAELHDIDPTHVGLGDFGRPHGYLERQVGRWNKQLESSRSRDLQVLDALFEWVAATVPDTSESTIVHGDFRLDNTLLHRTAGAPAVAAVLDWEMSTLGDPLSDLGLLGVYWNFHSLDGAESSPLASAIDPQRGYVGFDEIVDAYASARSINIANIDWYVAFGAFKLAVILEGIHYRYQLGHTVGEGFETIGALVPEVAKMGLGRGEKKRRV